MVKKAKKGPVQNYMAKIEIPQESLRKTNVWLGSTDSIIPDAAYHGRVAIT